jgi:hypothetical protein
MACADQQERNIVSLLSNLALPALPLALRAGRVHTGARPTFHSTLLLPAQVPEAFTPVDQPDPAYWTDYDFYMIDREARALRRCSASLVPRLASRTGAWLLSVTLR